MRNLMRPGVRLWAAAVPVSILDALNVGGCCWEVWGVVVDMFGRLLRKLMDFWGEVYGAM